MNIDERLEALTRNAEAHDRQIEAHDRQIEALLSLAAKHGSENADRDRRIEGLLSLAAKHDSQIVQNSIDIASLRTLWNDIAEGIGRLVHTAELHQNRLDSHSDRLDNLENT